MSETCERLVAGGPAALARRRLRPDPASRYSRRQFHLEAGRRGRRRHRGLSICWIRRNFKNSPLAIVFGEGREVRYRIDDPESKRFPFFDDMRAEGVTDYIALPLLVRPTARFTHRAGPRKQPGGFSDDATGRPAIADAAAGPARSRSPTCAARLRSCSTPMSATAPASAFSAARSGAATPRPCMPRSGCRICAALPRCRTGCRPRPWSIFSISISTARCRRSGPMAAKS